MLDSYLYNVQITCKKLDTRLPTSRIKQYIKQLLTYIIWK